MGLRKDREASRKVITGRMAAQVTLVLTNRDRTLEQPQTGEFTEVAPVPGRQLHWRLRLQLGPRELLHPRLRKSCGRLSG